MKKVLFQKEPIIFMKLTINYKLKIGFVKFLLSLGLITFFWSCEPKKMDTTTIQLKWNKGYAQDSIERKTVALKWCLTFLGSHLAADTSLVGLNYNDSIIKLDVSQIGFSKAARTSLQKLNGVLKSSEEYKTNGSLDVGRYIALTIGSPLHYYKIVEVPKHIDEFKSKYAFDSLPVYINNSSIAHGDRIIFSASEITGTKQAYLSLEVDSIHREVLEFETVELMPNGLSKFALYDHDGNLKASASPEITRAGKPAKCMWCHEIGIQPLFRDQVNVKGFLTHEAFQDSIDAYNERLRAHQKKYWKDPALLHKKLHTEMEIAYISFMEPSLEYVANEWNLPIETVKTKLASLKTHRHEEFDFLGDLYHRREIDALAPFKVIDVPESIREESENEPNYLGNLDFQ